MSSREGDKVRREERKTYLDGRFLVEKRLMVQCGWVEMYEDDVGNDDEAQLTDVLRKEPGRRRGRGCYGGGGSLELYDRLAVPATRA